MAIELPNRLLDYVLYYECGKNEKKTPALWSNPTSIAALQPGGLTNAINWSAAGNDVGDGAGMTKCGVVLKYSKPKGYNIDSLNSWLGYLKRYFWQDACSSNCANVATAVQLFQGKWAGWTPSAMSSIIKTLKSKADKPTTGIGDSGYSAIAKLTHCFSNPMDAFIIIRAARIAYLRSCGNASKFANGWMRREFFAMQKDGLYIETGNGTSKYGFTPISTMEQVAESLKRSNSSTYVKLLDWDGDISSGLADDLSDGSDGSMYFGNDFSASNSGVPNYSHGTIQDGGTFSQGLNPSNSRTGLIVGTSINQRGGMKSTSSSSITTTSNNEK